MKKLLIILCLISIGNIHSVTTKISKTLTKKDIQKAKARKIFRAAPAEMLQQRFEAHSEAMGLFAYCIGLAQRFGGKDFTIEKAKLDIHNLANDFCFYMNTKANFLKYLSTATSAIIFTPSLADNNKAFM